MESLASGFSLVKLVSSRHLESESADRGPLSLSPQPFPFPPPPSLPTIILSFYCINKYEETGLGAKVANIVGLERGVLFFF